MRPTQILLLSSLLVFPACTLGVHQYQEIKSKNLYRGAKSDIVLFHQNPPSAVTQRQNEQSAQGITYTNAPATLEDIHTANIGYAIVDTRYVADLTLHKPKCAQMIYKTFYIAQQCELPPACGITIIVPIYDGWFKSEQACISLFTSSTPNVTITSFQREHQHHWARQYELFPPFTMTNKLTLEILPNYILLEYLDETYQVLPKYFVQQYTTYSNITHVLTPSAWSQQGKLICYHTPDPLVANIPPRVATPQLALLAASIVYVDSLICNTGATYIDTQGQICQVVEEYVLLRLMCNIQCRPQTTLNCDPQSDTFAPPGYIERGLLMAAIYIWDLFSHSYIYLYTKLLNAIHILWVKLNSMIYMAEYSILFLVATMYFKNVYAGAAAVILLATIIGITRY